MEPVRFATVGLGGYGRWIMKLLADAGDRTDAPVKLVAAVDPNLETFESLTTPLQSRGVRLYSAYEQVLKQDRTGRWEPTLESVDVDVGGLVVGTDQRLRPQP